MTEKKSRFDISLGEDKVFIRLSSRFDDQQYTWASLRHCNAEYELHIAMSGSCQLEIEDHTYLLTAPQAIIIPPGLYHYPYELSETFEHFTISFTLSDGALLRSLSNAESIGIPFSISGEPVSLCRSIYREYIDTSLYRSEMLHALLSGLIISILRPLRLKEGKEDARLLTEEAERVVLMDEFFSSCFTENARAEALAERLHLSKRQLARVVKQHYGMCFQQKLTNSRMDRAAWLLRTSDQSIGEIAELVGYSSEAAFYQVFRDWFHLTPGQYRRQF